MLGGSPFDRRLKAVVGARNVAEAGPSRCCRAGGHSFAFVGEQIMRRVLI